MHTSTRHLPALPGILAPAPAPASTVVMLSPRALAIPHGRAEIGVPSAQVRRHRVSLRSHGGLRTPPTLVSLRLLSCPPVPCMDEGGIPTLELYGQLNTSPHTRRVRQAAATQSHRLEAQRRRMPHAVQSHTGRHSGTEETTGAVGGRLCRRKRARCPLVPKGRCGRIVQIMRG